MPPLHRNTPEDHDATKHISFSEREANHDANENYKLGRAAARKKDHAGAMLHYHMALKNQREVLGHEHPVVATTLNAIGLVLMEAGDINVSQVNLPIQLSRRFCKLTLSLTPFLLSFCNYAGRPGRASRSAVHTSRRAARCSR